MGNPRKKPILGITGGIASGKSTVAAELEKLGCAVIRADALVHEMLEEEPVRDEIVRLFGREILTPSGDIDRGQLAEIVFSDAEKLATLNNLLHPRVLQRTEELIAEYNQRTHAKAIVLDMPLLIEVGWANRCDRLIFVRCDRQRRVERARQTGFNERDVEIRENFQISVDEKATLADNALDNNSDFSTLVRQIKEIFSDITRSR